MGGGLVQLAAYGSQDIYLTSNPTITYFKAVYHRYTNFTMEAIPQLIDGNINFGGSITLVIARNGDLLGNIMLQFTLPDFNQYITGNYDYIGYIQGVGNYLINNTSIEIGGQQIDEQYGQWMDIWSELNLSESQLTGYGKMVGRNYSMPQWQPYPVDSQPGSLLQVPLLFWFCRNPGLAVPIIALQYADIKVKLQFEKFKNLIVAVTDGNYVTPTFNPFTPQLNPNNTFRIFNNYYFLDTTERRKFAQNPHEYLVEQVQSQTGNILSLTEDNYIRLNLNHPSKELVFVFNRNGTAAPMCDFSMGVNASPNGTVAQFSPLESFKLLINGSDRFKERPGEYFRLAQNYFHHTRMPNNYIYTYSFSLRPEENQPSGSCNFSRIDNAQLWFYIRNKSKDSVIVQNYSELPGYSLYCPCYNILRIMGGMAGLSYSN